MSESSIGITVSQNSSKAGKARAAKLSPERRSEIAKIANQHRKCNQNIPKATHYGLLQIGPIEITCAVLENGKRVISENSIFKLFGMKGGGRKLVGGAKIPRFLANSNLKPFIVNDEVACPQSFYFRQPNNVVAYGYEAVKVVEILLVYLDARRAGVLTDKQIPIAATAEIIMSSLAKIGIIGLIDEALGFQEQRNDGELQELFSKFIEKELQPWTQRFPLPFFENIKRIYNLQHLKMIPSFAGHWINKYIYSQISPGILEELKKRNPTQDNGKRKHCHHQYLTQDLGCPALEKQVLRVNTILSLSDTKEEFENNFKKFLSKKEKEYEDGKI
jgi:hypothetical protein